MRRNPTFWLHFKNLSFVRAGWMRLCLFDVRQIPRCHFTQDNSLFPNTYECYTRVWTECTWQCLDLLKHVHTLSTEIQSVFSLKSVCSLFSVSSSCPRVFPNFTPPPQKKTYTALARQCFLPLKTDIHPHYVQVWTFNFYLTDNTFHVSYTGRILGCFVQKNNHFLLRQS
jgi:hypothetical protein